MGGIERRERRETAPRAGEAGKADAATFAVRMCAAGIRRIKGVSLSAYPGNERGARIRKQRCNFKSRLPAFSPFPLPVRMGEEIKDARCGVARLERAARFIFDASSKKRVRARGSKKKTKVQDANGGRYIRIAEENDRNDERIAATMCVLTK